MSRGIIVDLAMHRYGALAEPSDKDFEDKLAEWRGRGHPFLEEDAGLSVETPHVMIERAAKGLIRGYRLYQPHGHASRSRARSARPGWV